MNSWEIVSRRYAPAGSFRRGQGALQREFSGFLSPFAHAKSSRLVMIWGSVGWRRRVWLCRAS